MTTEPATEWFLGVPLSLVDTTAAAALIAARDEALPFAYVVTPNAQHMVRLRQGDAGFREGYGAAWLRLCDSQIMRLLARLLFGLTLPHATGSDTTVRLFAAHIQAADRMTVIGGGEALRAALVDRYKLTALALYDPPMGFIKRPEEVRRCLDFVLAHPARYVFLAVGAPQSEVLARRIHDSGRATGVGLCIGSSLLFVTGQVKRAPKLFRRWGLEWLWRLALAPRRHARRVFVDSLPLVWIALRSRLAPAAIRHQPRHPAP